MLSNLSNIHARKHISYNNTLLTTLLNKDTNLRNSIPIEKVVVPHIMK
jgi:hypothetical protein